VSVKRVILVDDHDMVRQGLGLFLKMLDDFELVGEAHDGVEAVELCRTLSPDIVFMDLHMPQMDGVRATQIICENHPQVRVIALTSSGENDEVVQAVIAAGAMVCLNKQASVDELADVIYAAVR